MIAEYQSSLCCWIHCVEEGRKVDGARRKVYGNLEGHLFQSWPVSPISERKNDRNDFFLTSSVILCQLVGSRAFHTRNSSTFGESFLSCRRFASRKVDFHSKRYFLRTPEKLSNPVCISRLALVRN